jgi:hypothetical protein
MAVIPKGTPDPWAGTVPAFPGVRAKLVVVSPGREDSPGPKSKSFSKGAGTTETAVLVSVQIPVLVTSETMTRLVPAALRETNELSRPFTKGWSGGTRMKASVAKR